VHLAVHGALRLHARDDATVEAAGDGAGTAGAVTSEHHAPAHVAGR
jgi:deoxycytidylate deaminase